MRTTPSLIVTSVLLMFPLAHAIAQSAHEKSFAIQSNVTPKPAWDTSLAGQWTYRSYLNDPSVLVNADPDPAVQALSPIYGSDNLANAAAALKALNLIFGEGIITFDPPAGNALTGNLDMGGGLVLDLNGTMQATPSGDIGIVVIGTGREDVDRIYTSCRLAGHNGNSLGVKNEESEGHPDIFVCGAPRRPWPEFWEDYQGYG